MDDLSGAVKFVAAAIGARSIRLRTGLFGVSEAPLMPLMPYIAAYVNVSGRIMFADDVIDCEFNAGSSPAVFHSFGGILSASPFTAILIHGLTPHLNVEELDLRLVEDASRRFVAPTDLSVLVNAALCSAYKDVVLVGAAPALSDELIKVSELSTEVGPNGR